MSTSTDNIFWVHSYNSFLIRYDEFSGLRYYGLAYMLGIFTAWYLLKSWNRQGLQPIGGRDLSDFILLACLVTIAGGRLGYCLLYSPKLFITFEANFPFWGVLMTAKGGMSSHGGFLGVGILLCFYSKLKKYPLLLIADAVSTCAPIGIALGRMANFMNGELWGRPTRLPWGVHFPDTLLVLDKKLLEDRWSHFSESRNLHISLHHYYNQLVKGSAEWSEFYRHMTVARHPYPIYASLFEGLLIFIIARLIYGRIRCPGLICSIVIGLYGASRFIGEYFRQWDYGLNLYFGLSRGQLYTLPMIAISIVSFFYLLRHQERGAANEGRSKEKRVGKRKI